MSSESYAARITGEIFSHRLLWHTAQSLHKRASKEPSGSYHGYLAAVMFTFFASEAFLNFLGEKVAPDEWSQERDVFSKDPYRGTYGKLRLLCERLKLKPGSNRPWSSLEELAEARFAVVHARPDRVDQVFKASRPEDVPTHRDPVIFAYGEAAFATRVMDDAEEVADQLMTAALAAGYRLDAHGPRAFRGMTWHQGGHVARE
jgi:hypothetical protein